jgi:hypothetical protein
VADRAKKLITGETATTGDDGQGMDLLKRLLVLWDAEPHNEERASVLGEIQQWLDRGNNVCTISSFIFSIPKIVSLLQSEALVRAQEAVAEITQLRIHAVVNERSVRDLRRQIQERDTRALHRSDTVAATEESLRERVRQLERYVLQLFNI